MKALETLKNTVMMYVAINDGLSEQLAGRLLKCIDFLEDNDEDRKYREMDQLSDYIIADCLELERSKWQGLTDPLRSFAAELTQALESTMTRHERLQLLSESLKARSHKMPGRHSTSASISE